MKIYGVALLAACYLAGQLLGNLLGYWLGIGGNVGGVGFGMLFLVLANTRLELRDAMTDTSRDGILFWTSMYIPVIVAMSATQNVKAALSGGWVAVLAGILATTVCFFLVPVITSMSKEQE